MINIVKLDIPGNFYRPVQRKYASDELPFEYLDSRLQQRVTESEWQQFACDLLNVRWRASPTLLSLLTNDLCASPCCNLCISNDAIYEKHVKEFGIRRVEMLPEPCDACYRSDRIYIREACCLCFMLFNLFTCCYMEQYVGIKSRKKVLNGTYDVIARYNKYLFQPRGIDVRIVMEI